MRWITLAAVLVGCTSGTIEDPDTDADTDTDTDSDTDADSDWDVGADTYIPAGFGTDDPAYLFILGDSISAGGGASRSGLRYVNLLQENDSNAWPAYDDVDLESLWGEMPPVIDVSEGGARTINVVYEQIPNLEDQLSLPVQGEVVVIVTIGGNDLAEVIVFPSRKDQAIEGIDDNLNAMLDFFLDGDNFPDGAYVYFTNVYDPSDGVGTADGCFTGLDTTAAVEALEISNANSREMAEDRGASWVDLHGHFLGHGHNYDDTSIDAYDADDPTLWFASDCIHPNDRGHHELRRLFHAAISGTRLPAE